jgi:glycine hydroxymethyltransferase
MNTIAALAVALGEADTDSFKEYAHQVVNNAKVLANTLQDVYCFSIISSGTDSHLMVIDLTSKGIDGKTAAISLEKAGIEVNYNTVPYDTNPPSRPSGIRLGTSVLTTIGMKESDMVFVAALINKVIENYNDDFVLASIKESVSDWVTNIRSANKNV